MSTFVQIGAQALQAAQKWARRLRLTFGKGRPDVVGKDRAAPSSLTDDEASTNFYGFRPKPGSGTPVTNEFVNQLRDESGV
jgi:hypothetical protein